MKKYHDVYPEFFSKNLSLSANGVVCMIKSGSGGDLEDFNASLAWKFYSFFSFRFVSNTYLTQLFPSIYII